MKRLWVLIALVLLTGCTGSRNELDRVMALRADLLAAECGFRAEVTADYGDTVHSFTLDCESDTTGNLKFTVVSPESIAGITGTVSRQGGALTFDGTALAFPLLADGQFSPVSGPWVLMQTLRGGYVSAVGEEDGFLRATIHDSFDDDALVLDIWLDEKNIPVRAEILWDGRRVLTMKVETFAYL